MQKLLLLLLLPSISHDMSFVVENIYLPSNNFIGRREIPAYVSRKEKRIISTGFLARALKHSTDK